MATKAEKERTARIDAGLRGSEGHPRERDAMTEEEIVAERDRVLHGDTKEAKAAAKASGTAGSVPDTDPQPQP